MKFITENKLDKNSIEVEINKKIGFILNFAYNLKIQISFDEEEVINLFSQQKTYFEKILEIILKKFSTKQN